jgi:hypothetical protein
MYSIRFNGVHDADDYDGLQPVSMSSNSKCEKQPYFTLVHAKTKQGNNNQQTITKNYRLISSLALSKTSY